MTDQTVVLNQTKGTSRKKRELEDETMTMALIELFPFEGGYSGSPKVRWFSEETKANLKLDLERSQNF